MNQKLNPIMDTKTSTNPSLPKKRKVIIRRKVKPKKETSMELVSEPVETNGIPNIEHYISTMNIHEKRALDIAKESLGSSFDIEDSIGYKDYVVGYKKE